VNLVDNNVGDVGKGGGRARGRKHAEEDSNCHVGDASRRGSFAVEADVEANQ